MSFNKKHKCHLCPYVAVTPSALGRHVRTHTNEKPFQCPHCTFSSAQETALKLHIGRLHSGPAEREALRKYKCELCNYSSDQKGGLDIHLRGHTGEKPFQCTEDGCDKAFNRKLSLQLHIKVHKDERPFKCEFPGCEYRARVKRMLTEHWAVHDNERPFKCPVPECKYKAKLQSSLYKHARVHRDPKYACSFPGCNYKARQKINIRDHETIHSDYRPLQCPFPGCSYSAKRQSTLSSHKKTHKGAGRPHRCMFADCNRRFQNPYQLREHERFHNGEEPYKCNFPDCEHKTWYKWNLKMHQKLHHPHKLVCEFNGCTYIGKTQSHLKTHARCHQNPAYSSCPIVSCNFRSKSAKTLKIHKKVHDSEGKSYSCPLCPRHYKWQCQFEGHLRRHNGEKPYKCPDCDLTCVSVYGVNSHFKRVHGRELSVRDVVNHRLKKSHNHRQCSHRCCSFNTDGVCNLKSRLRKRHNSAKETTQIDETKTECTDVPNHDSSGLEIDWRKCFVTLERITVLYEQ